jgi:hypothetical protein
MSSSAILSSQVKRGLVAELDAAPGSDLTAQVLTDASQFYDRIRRLKKKDHPH